MPLVFVLGVTAIKDGNDDWVRRCWAAFFFFFFLLPPLLFPVCSCHQRSTPTVLSPLRQKRHKSDRQINNRRVRVLRDGVYVRPLAALSSAHDTLVHLLIPPSLSPFYPPFSRWQKITWQKMETGEMVRLEKDDFVPADLVIISSSEEDAACFIETADLDGETNLKKKYALAETRDAKTAEEISAIESKTLVGARGRPGLASCSLVLSPISTAHG